ncbi:MAG: Signal transduction histidine kinase [Bacteroidetes bacterium]|nr:Signal transduction histidine kinase [Bacteroidota bacterium]
MEEKINILLVEDNPGDARLIDIYLKESFENIFSLMTADYLSKGLELLEKHEFTIIILDLSLPDSDGLDTFKRIHEKASDTPIIVLTGMEDESMGINAMKLGAQDFLVKGKLKVSNLKRSIKYSIERYRLLNELSEKTKKLEEQTQALNREKLRLAEAQKLAHIGNWEWNIETNIFTWSEELYRIYRLDPSEVVTYDRLIDLTHLADKEYVKTMMETSISEGKPFNFYYRIIRPDKTIRTLDAKGEAIRNDSGKVVRVIGTLQDVSERVNEEEMEKLAVAATKSNNSVIIADKEGRIKWINEGFTKLTGYTLEEVKDTHGEVLRKGSDTGLSQQANFYLSVITEKKPVIYESKNYAKDGSEYFVITTLTPVLNKEGNVERILAIESDITLRKKIEEELIRANKVAEQSLKEANNAVQELMQARKELEELMKVKEQFLANMSHEIRTPMNAIVGFTSLLLKTELNAEQKQYINAVKTSGENLLVIINDILDFSKIQSGKFVFEQIEFRLSQVFSTFTEMMLPKSTEKNIQLLTKIDKKIPDHLIGDPTRLNQIFLNLVGNAIKFTEMGEVKVTVDLLKESGDEVELEFKVIDSGIGIPENKLASVFEGFTQASNETTRKYGGTGLGLTIVKQLIEMQGGSIRVESKVGEGSVFTFNIKFKKNLNPDTGKKKVQEMPEPEFLKELHILLVEDNNLNQILAKKVLNDWHWKVDVADNGLMAVEKIKNNDYDVVLMDIQMPEMDGYEATRRVRKTFDEPRCHVPIIAMTAHALAGEAEKCLNVGMDDYISKPFDKKMLYSKIISAINKNYVDK